MARKAQQSSIKKRVPKQQKLNSRAAKKATTSSDQSDIEEDEHQSQGIADLLAGLQGQLSKKSAQQANKLLLEHEARLGNALEEVRSQATVLDEKRSDKIRSQKRKVEQASEQHGREVAKLTAEYKNAIGKWSHAIDLVDGHVDVVRRAEDECFLDMEGIESGRVAGSANLLIQMRNEVDASKVKVHGLIKKSFVTDNIVKGLGLLISP